MRDSRIQRTSLGLRSFKSQVVAQSSEVYARTLYVDPTGKTYQKKPTMAEPPSPKTTHTTQATAATTEIMDIDDIPHPPVQKDMISADKPAIFEHRIRACFRPRTSTSGRNRHNQRQNLDITTAVKGLTTALLSLGKTTIKDGDNNIASIDHFPATEAAFEAVFEMGEPAPNGSIDIYFAINSTWSFGKIKSDNAIWKYLTEQHIYLFPQSFAKVHELSCID
jgi:hypothetical protein